MVGLVFLNVMVMFTKIMSLFKANSFFYDNKFVYCRLHVTRIVPFTY